MVIPFDPQHITSHISMNRVKIVDLPGIPVPDEVKGKTGFQLLSSEALVQQVRPNAAELRLAADLDAHELVVAFAGCLTHEDPTVRAVASHISQQFGQNLGYLLLTLKRGDAVNRAARPEWDDNYWDYWAKINTVWLGGGMVSGKLGQVLRKHALAVFAQDGASCFQLHVSPYGLALSLVGAARHAPPGSKRALVFDFGSTFIKRAVAQYDTNMLVELHLLPPVSTQWKQQNIELETNPKNLFDYMVQVISDTWNMVGAVETTILASIACYLDGGHPQEYQGGRYTQLRLITNNLQNSLSESVSKHLSGSVEIRLIHDGTAAAATYAGSRNTAVLTLGTALGVGFPPPNDECPYKLGDVKL